MRFLYSIIFVVSVGLFAGGCSSARINSDQVVGVDFSAFKTYAWLPNGRDTTNKSILNNEITLQNIRAAADKEMMGRGYRLDASDPDLLLMAHTNFEKREEIVTRPYYSSYSYYHPGFSVGPWYPYYYSGYYNVPYIHGYGIEEIQYTEGTVVIDVIDREKNQLIWRGWSEERLYDYEDVEALYENVDKIFAEYPVKARKKRK